MPKFFNAITNQLVRFAVEKGWAEDWLRGRDSWLGGTATKLTRPYLQHVWVHVCISTIAEAIASVPYRLYRGEKEITTGPFFKLFRDINPDMTADQFWEGISTYREIRGDCCVIKEKMGGSDRSPTKEFWVFDSKNFKHVLGKDGRLVGWEYIAAMGNKIPFTRNEILFFKYINPYDPIRGTSKLGIARMAADQDYAASKYNQQFFENSAEGGGLLSTDKKLTESQMDSVIERWEHRHKGASRAHKIAIAHSGLKYQTTALSHKDAQFLEQRMLNREEIAGIFKVPPVMIGIFRYANYANSKEQIKIFWTNCIIPKLKYYESVLDSNFFPFEPNGADVVGRFDLSGVEALAEDTAKKIEIAKTMFGMGVPFNVINERLELGMDDIPGGDVGYLPFNVIAIGSEAPEKPPKQESISGPIDKLAELVKQVSDTPEVRVDQPGGIKAPRFVPDFGLLHEAKWRRFVTSFSPLENQLSKKLKEYFYEQRKEVLSNFFARVTTGQEPQITKEITPEIIEQILFIMSIENEKLLAMIQPYFAEALEIGGNQIIADLGMEALFDLGDPRAIDFLKTKANKIIDINQVTWNQLKESIAQGLAEGEGAPELAQRIRHTYNIAANRSKTIARTEMSECVNGGRQESMEILGVKRQVWSAAMDEVTRETHIAENGNEVELDTPFPVTGLMYPGDMAGPPEEVINCRCFAEPIPPEEG